MGSFRPGAGNQHLHWYFNFTGCIVETALKSLRLSCGSEPVSYTHLVLEDDKVEVFPNGINGDRFRKYNKTYARDYFCLLYTSRLGN